MMESRAAIPAARAMAAGHGTFHWPDGTEFEGLWHASEIVGPGCHRFPNGAPATPATCFCVDSSW